jgi:hypothetical protein
MKFLFKEELLIYIVSVPEEIQSILGILDIFSYLIYLYIHNVMSYSIMRFLRT